MALSQWRIALALDVELAAFSPDSLDAPLLSLALRYRTAAERAWYKALAELQRLRAHTLAEQKLEAQAAEAETRRELERLCFAPIIPTRAPAPPRPRRVRFANHRAPVPRRTR